jgi:formylglycine-generating enzyme required for sulfatase activity
MNSARFLALAVMLAAACGGTGPHEGGSDGGGVDPTGGPDGSADEPSDAGASSADAAAGDSSADAAAIDAGPVPPSCVGLGASCGAGDCCASLVVPGGTFDRANDPAGPATIAAFRLDRFEVTVGRFRRFVAAGGGTAALVPPAGLGAHPSLLGSGWQSSWNAELEPDAASLMARLQSGPGHTWTNAPGANEARPINHVVWLEAFAFCAWDGGRLPTEAELSFAAVGGSEQRVYPWSVPPSSSVIDSSYAAHDCLGDGLPACADADLRPVGSYSPKGDGRWGHADLVGNVAEWALDQWNAAWLLPCTDCARLRADLYTFRISGGGDYRTDPSDLTGAKRRDLSAFYRWDRQGLRCARRL